MLIFILVCKYLSLFVFLFLGFPTLAMVFRNRSVPAANFFWIALSFVVFVALTFPKFF